MIIYWGKCTSFCKIISWRDDPNGVSLYLSTPRGNLILLFSLHVKAYLYIKISQPRIIIYTGPDGAKGRASASGAGGREFESRPRHTKGVKNGTSGYLAWRSALLGKHWLSSHSLLTLLTLHKNKKKTTTQLTPSTWFPGTRLKSPSGVKMYR